MTTSRMEAFSDGVIAIIITVMVLELKVPHGYDLSALRAAVPSLLTYVLSFVFLGIYWNNHHHMLQATQQVNGRILWANLHLLFWLSLVPWTMQYWSENHRAPWPTAIYGVVLLFSAIAYTILQRQIIAHQGRDATLGKAVGSDTKGQISLAMYAVAIGLSFVNPFFSLMLYVGVAVLWLVPDRRIETVLEEEGVPQP